MGTTTKAPKLRGFAALSPERRREISAKGGLIAHQKGKAHRFTSEEAKIAGSKSAATRARRASLKTSALVPDTMHYTPDDSDPVCGSNSARYSTNIRQYVTCEVCLHRD